MLTIRDTDSAINGVLQSLDPYSAYMSPELFKETQPIQEENLEVWIEIGMGRSSKSDFSYR